MIDAWRKSRLLSGEQLEGRFCLSAVSFATHVITAPEVNRPTSVFAADLDGDGDADVVSSSEGDHRIAWYENIDGEGRFSAQNTITTDARGASALQVEDIDGDGDMDIIAASRWDDTVAWYENTDGQGSFGGRNPITTTARNVHSAFVADMDGDGDADVVAGSYSTRDADGLDYEVVWYENMDGRGSFGARKIVGIELESSNAVHAADIDMDGDQDIVSAYGDGGWFFNNGGIAWYENIDGAGTFGAQQLITSAGVDWATSIYLTDLDGDADTDIVAAIDSNIVWYANTDGGGRFVDQGAISSEGGFAGSVFAADLDRDGDMDVIAASDRDDIIAWHENTDGKGSFGARKTITSIVHETRSVHAADLDGDGDVDVLSASAGDNTLAWYQNDDGLGSFGEQNLIVVNTGTGGATSVYAADLDGDGDLDALSASRDDQKIAWFANTDGRGSFGQSRVISGSANGARSVRAADLDGDGDMDVVARVSRFNGNLVWYENTDGRGTFSAEQIVSPTTSFAQTVETADLDGDGDVDLLSASLSYVGWYENIDGKGRFRDRIVTQISGVDSVYPVDVDSDGDLDVVLAYSIPNGQSAIAWVENANGRGGFRSRRMIITREVDRPQTVHAADVDQDGDMDVIAGSVDMISWYDNTNGQGGFGNRKTITTTVNWPEAVFAADIDLAHGVDVLSASGDSIAWYMNANEGERFSRPNVVTTAENGWYEFVSLYVIDVEGDGDVDIFSASSGGSTIAWYENLMIQPGDANRDGVFDRHDIIQVLQVGQYQDDTPGNSTWVDGDWNRDGDFDANDIAFALAARAYDPTAERT